MTLDALSALGTISPSMWMAHIALDALLAGSYLLLVYMIVYLNQHRYITIFVPKRTYSTAFFIVFAGSLAMTAYSVLFPSDATSVVYKSLIAAMILTVVLGVWRVVPRDIDPLEHHLFHRENHELVEAQRARIHAENRLRSVEAEMETLVEARTTELSRANLTLGKEIVEHRLTEERVAESKRRLDELIMRTNTALVMLSEAGEILECNHAMAHLLGRGSVSEITGRKLTRLLGLRTGADIDHFCAEALRLGSFRYEFAATPPARGAIHVEASGAATVIDDRPCIMAFLRDVSERKAFENELVQGREGLSAALHVARQANSTKSDFLAKMNHELRTPLNGIIGLSEVLRHKATGTFISGEQIQGLVSNIHQSGTHLLSLVDDLLDLSRLDSGTREFNPADLVVSAEIDSAIMTLTSIADKKRITLTKVCDPELEWRMDQRAFKQVIINLVNNAIKFSPPGSTVHVAITTTPNALMLHVRDQGPGISEDEQAHILSPFGRGKHAEENKIDGVGLGLTIVSELLKLQGGTLGIKSKKGNGAEFTAMIPAAIEIPNAPLTEERRATGV